MTPEVINKLLETDKRSRVVAAAKLGNSVARALTGLGRKKKNISYTEVSYILQEAGYRADVADVMVAMSALRTLVPQFFEVFDYLDQTELHCSALDVMQIVENWLKDPSDTTEDQVLSQSVSLHDSYCDWLDRRDEQEAAEEEIDDEDLERDHRRFEPEAELYTSLRELCRLTSHRERTAAISPDGFNVSVTMVLYYATSLHDLIRQTVDDKPYKAEFNPSLLLPLIKHNLITELLRIE